MEQRLDEARAAMSLIEEEAREYRLEMMRFRQLTWECLDLDLLV